jgi:flagellar motor component MotA
MFSIIGIVVLMVCVFGGYVMAGGSMAPIIKAAPIETFIIGGAAVAAMLIGNSIDIVKGAFGGILRCFKGPKYKKDDYLQVIFLVSKLMKVLKAEGAVALEPHIENPDSSAIFAEYPPILKDEGLLHLVCDTIRLLVVSSSNLSPYAVEEVMDQAIKTHHHGELKPAEALASMAGALPALGIVACVLGVVKTSHRRCSARSLVAPWSAPSWACFSLTAWSSRWPPGSSRSLMTRARSTRWSSRSSLAPCTAIRRRSSSKAPESASATTTSRPSPKSSTVCAANKALAPSHHG